MTVEHVQNSVRSRASTVDDPIPLVDLQLQNERVAEEVREGIAEVIATGAFVLGPAVDRFEREYANFCGAEHCVGVGSGTEALELALQGARIGTGDEVVVPTNTFVATAEAVVRTGATLVLADCTDDFLIDPASVAERVTTRTRAVIGVDLYGQVAPFEDLRAAVGPDVLLLEDAAQSVGATRHGATAGTFGIAAATSFYPGKNLGAFGDGGAVVTNDDQVAERVRALRNHGGVRKYEHKVVGTTSRLDSIQAVVLSAKLPLIDAWNAERREAADRYVELLGGVEEVVLPRVAPGNEHVWHVFVVRVPDRDHVLERLQQAGIGAGIHYPTPVHLLEAFAGLGAGAGSFPVAERIAGEILSLPIYPGITADQQERVASVLRESYS